MTDWQLWHSPYDDPTSALSARLSVVQEQLSLALDRAPAGPLRLLSLCAGQGRDVLPVLARHPRGRDVTGRLVELHPDLADIARRASPPGLEVMQGDAGTTAAFAGAVPVDVLLLCGIFGNVEDDDVERTIRAVPSLLAHGGTVLWTRHRGAPDLTPAIRGWFADVGVHEIAFVSQAPAAGWAVGAGVLNGSGTALGHHGRLFTFTRRPPAA